MTQFMTFDQEAARKSGGSEYIQDGGAYVVKITSAKMVSARSGSEGVELSCETKEGLKANYLTLYYSKSDGTPIKSGTNALNALMFLTRSTSLSMQNNGSEMIVPELIGKEVGLCLQKRLYTKGDGSDGFSFEIVMPFGPSQMATVKEITDKKPASAVSAWVSRYQDKDERNQGAAPYQQSGGNQMPDYMDDVPF